jgi:acyl-CoA thioesterase I
MLNVLRTGIEKNTATVQVISRLLLNIRLLLIVLTASLITITASANPASQRILVVGDSISAGFGIPVQQGWVVLLQEQLQQLVPGVLIHNASISGDTTQGGIARLPALLQEQQPDLLIIELGGNDALRGTPLPLIEKNLAAMIAMAEHEGIMVMLLGMKIPPNYGQKYADGFTSIYAKLAREQETLYLPFLLEGVATHPELMQADGIHPTAAAQPAMAKAVLGAMEVWIEFATE